MPKVQDFTAWLFTQHHAKLKQIHRNFAAQIPMSYQCKIQIVIFVFLQDGTNVLFNLAARSSRRVESPAIWISV